jgi:putative flippase GtrA
MSGRLGQLGRFGVVGVSNTLITLVAFALLTRVGVAAPVASAAGFAAGAANGYRLNRTWTFRSDAGGVGVVARYIGVQAAGTALSAVGVALASSDLELRHVLAEALVLPLLSFALSRRLVFHSAATA